MSDSQIPVALSLRIDLPNGQRIGPGKLALLRSISNKGSVSSAARALGLSYPKALKLVEALNASFANTLVETRHGGSDRGGARLTETGVSVLKQCEEALAAAQDATVQARLGLARLLGRPEKD